MKRLILISLISLSFTDVFSQTNTFPASGNVGIGTTNPYSKLEVLAGSEGQTAPITAIKIWGPNEPPNANSAQDLKWSFSSAGSAIIRGYRGGSWDTYLQFLTNNINQGADVPMVRMTITDLGNVGIGTTNPFGNLQVMNSSAGFDGSNVIYLTNDNTSYGRTNLILTGRLTNGNDAWAFGSGARNSIVFNVNQAADGANVGAIGTEYYSIQLEGNSKSLGFLSNQNGASPNLVLLQNGNIGIGTTSPQSKLAVNGTITATQVKVTQTGWSDFVFDSAYRLPALSNTETFIKENHHLPDIPSAKQIESKGLNLGDMEKRQMQKIEELTLYIIAEDKKITDQQQQLKAQNKQILIQQQTTSQQQEEIDCFKKQLNDLLKDKSGKR